MSPLELEQSLAASVRSNPECACLVSSAGFPTGFFDQVNYRMKKHGQVGGFHITQRVYKIIWFCNQPYTFMLRGV